jgi:hypothetical protein
MEFLMVLAQQVKEEQPQPPVLIGLAEVLAGYLVVISVRTADAHTNALEVN